MTAKEKMFLESKAWALEKLNLDKHYFERLAQLHKPSILWIGSIDSLVAARELINAEPGQILVYRNLGCQVAEDDVSLMATIQDAVEVSRVEHIIVCGYSLCSAIRDVILGNDDRPYVKTWLEPLKELYLENFDELHDLDFEQRTKRLCELNIQAQILKLSRLNVIRQSWEKHGGSPVLLGWYFDLKGGALKEIFSMQPNHKLEQLASVV
jgi:carbonic anhydrase